MGLQTRTKQRAKRDELFLKGPIRFVWIRENIPDPTCRVILVAEAFMKMSQPEKSSVELGQKIWDCAGVSDPDRRARVLRKIDTEVAGYRVARRPGRPAVLHRTPTTAVDRGLKSQVELNDPSQ
jgi:hypothetical protein